MNHSNYLVNKHNATNFTLLVICIAFIFRFFIAKDTGLGIGESYYFGGAKHLALSYYDQPPLFMWQSGILMRIFGKTNLVLRLPALFMFGGTTWLLFKITENFFDNIAGFYAALLFSFSGVFFLSGTWFQPDAPLMFFWIAYVYCLSKIIFQDSTKYNVSHSRGHTDPIQNNLTPGKPTSNNTTVYKWWMLSGLMLGFTILSKYHAIFLIFGLFLFLVNSTKSKHWLYHPGLYLSIALSLIVALPVFIWNLQHHFASFLFQGGRAFADGNHIRLHLDWFFRSIFGQSLWITPWVWVPLVLQLVKSFKLRNLDPHYGFCFWLALTPIVFFTVVTLWADLQYHFHWQAPGYMMLYIPLGKMVQDRMTQNTRWRTIMRRWLSFSVIFTSSVLIFLAVHMQTGFWTWYGPKWMGKKANGVSYDQTMEGYDYTDLSDTFAKNGWINNPNIFVGTTHWWMSGKVDWALKGKKDVVCFDHDARNYMYFSTTQALVGKDAIIVTRGNDATIKSNVAPFCDNLTPLPSVAIMRSGIDEVDLELYKCTNFHQSVTPLPELPVYLSLENKLP